MTLFFYWSGKMDFRGFLIVCICALLLTSSAFGTTPTLSWLQKHDGTQNSNDYAKDIVADSVGNIYVAGYAKNIDTGDDIVTIKYDSAGNAVWTKIYNRSAANSDYATAAAVDANSNIIVAGYGKSDTTDWDGLVVKYDSAGTQLWAAAYTSSGSNDDRFYDVVTDSLDNIYAVGRKAGDTLVVKYNANGIFMWAKTYNGPGNGQDVLYNAAVDSNNNLYACGEENSLSNGQNCLTVKYNSAGTKIWSKTLNGTADTSWDSLSDIAIDSVGSVYVTGSVENLNGSDYITIKYNPADGNEIWFTPYDSLFNGWDDSYAIAVTSDGHIAITGYSETAAGSEATTIKYNSSTGAQIWAASYNLSSDNYAQDIATDLAGNIYITGLCYNSGTYDYLTACYDSSGSQKWAVSYNGTGSNIDAADAIAVFDSSVYVTGKSKNASGNYDYATIKYTAAECSNPPAGDLNSDCVVNLFDLETLANGYTATLSEKLQLKDIADTWLDCGFADPNDCF